MIENTGPMRVGLDSALFFLMARRDILSLRLSSMRIGRWDGSFCSSAAHDKNTGLYYLPTGAIPPGFLRQAPYLKNIAKKTLFQTWFLRCCGRAFRDVSYQ